MDSYTVLAEFYDQLTTDVPYLRWADYIEKQFARNKTSVHSIVELGCGTGSLAAILSLPMLAYALVLPLVAGLVQAIFYEDITNGVPAAPAAPSGRHHCAWHSGISSRTSGRILVRIWQQVSAHP